MISCKEFHTIITTFAKDILSLFMILWHNAMAFTCDGYMFYVLKGRQMNSVVDVLHLRLI